MIRESKGIALFAALFVLLGAASVSAADLQTVHDESGRIKKIGEWRVGQPKFYTNEDGRTFWVAQLGIRQGDRRGKIPRDLEAEVQVAVPMVIPKEPPKSYGTPPPEWLVKTREVEIAGLGMVRIRFSGPMWGNPQTLRTPPPYEVVDFHFLDATRDRSVNVHRRIIMADPPEVWTMYARNNATPELREQVNQVFVGFHRDTVADAHEDPAIEILRFFANTDERLQVLRTVTSFDEITCRKASGEPVPVLPLTVSKGPLPRYIYWTVPDRDWAIHARPGDTVSVTVRASGFMTEARTVGFRTDRSPGCLAGRTITLGTAETAFAADGVARFDDLVLQSPEMLLLAVASPELPQERYQIKHGIYLRWGRERESVLDRGDYFRFCLDGDSPDSMFAVELAHHLDGTWDDDYGEWLDFPREREQYALVEYPPGMFRHLVSPTEFDFPPLNATVTVDDHWQASERFLDAVHHAMTSTDTNELALLRAAVDGIAACSLRDRAPMCYEGYGKGGRGNLVLSKRIEDYSVTVAVLRLAAERFREEGYLKAADAVAAHGAILARSDMARHHLRTGPFGDMPVKEGNRMRVFDEYWPWRLRAQVLLLATVCGDAGLREELIALFRTMILHCGNPAEEAYYRFRELRAETKLAMIAGFRNNWGRFGPDPAYYRAHRK